MPAKPRDYRTIARFSGRHSRAYLETHGDRLASFLAGLGAGDESMLKSQLANLAEVLELLDSAELIASVKDSTLRVAFRIYPAKDLLK
jgi:hypothetical protein